jgi:ABC-type transport system involved in multi-copper enzyme maturation permease subunit
MTGNTGLEVILIGFLQWMTIVGSMAVLVLFLALLVSFASNGLSGPKSVLGFIFNGPVARLGGKAGALLGVLLGGAAGWFMGPQAISQLSHTFSGELAQSGDTLGAVIGLIFCALLGLVLGPVVCASVFDSFHTSPRRIWALTILTIKESWARKLIWIFVVFVVLFMFISWFSDSDDTRADLLVKNSISTALTPITWLPLMVVMLLSCWGLPEDIKNRTIHTVVTKPVRRSEIFLGRILGFTCIGTFLLVVMGGVGYVWIMRQVPKKAQERLICRVPIYGYLQFTDRNGNPSAGTHIGDEDESRMYVEGGTKARATWTFRNITPDSLGEELTFESRFRAFRLYKGDMDSTLLGQIQFVRRLRKRTALSIGPTEEFNNVRQLIEAGEFTDAANSLSAVADGLEKKQLNVLPLSLQKISFGYETFANILEPFRQEKPESEWIGELITAAREVSQQAAQARIIELAAPLKQLSNLIRENAGELELLLVDVVAEPEIFKVQEFGENVIKVSRNISYQVGDQQPKSGNLFSDLVHGEELQVEVMCLDTGQFLGMAHPDMFVHAKINPFSVGYSKTIFGIWLMMIMIIIIGVTSSCLVKGPVGILLTLTLLVVGSFFHGFLGKVVQGEMIGGGAIEAAHRIFEHLNPQVQLEETNVTNIMRKADNTLSGSLWLLHKVVPNFNKFRMSEWIVEGFDVPWIGAKAALIPGFLMTLAYLLPCLLIGSYSLKLRELESK